ncbi:MAG TPA: ATP-binding cassette domain-containing protein, partial [Pyrinomonadaceae bacterium]|nr:ATP-binding cassette domain-containing protein [Pyrinomonadaceae bacterium]
MQQIIKDFPGVRALDGVSLALEKGEFHALVGENGAGKSTLMKVLSGAYPAGSFQGEILIENTPVRFSSVADSEAAGIAIIFQELSLVKDMTVAENIFLGQEPSRFGLIRWHELYSRTSALLRELGLEIDPQTPVGELGIGRQQLVEIAKALSKNARILVLDEPTAALTESEVEILFQILERLRRRGVGMIYISHKLEEVFRMADRITVLRDGRSVTSRPAKDFNRSKVIEYMVGRQVEDIFPDRIRQPGRVVFRASGINAYFPGSKRKAVDNVSFEVREGEV